jgi:hypothetical protein
MSRRPDIAIDKSQLIQLLTWFFFVISFFGICARVGTKYVMSRWSLRWDDTIVLLAEVRLSGRTLRFWSLLIILKGYIPWSIDFCVPGSVTWARQGREHSV